MSAKRKAAGSLWHYHGNANKRAQEIKARHVCRCDGILPLCSRFGSEDRAAPSTALRAARSALPHTMGIGGGVQRIEMTERETPVFGGIEFGAVGPYERLHGAVFANSIALPRRSMLRSSGKRLSWD